MKKFRNTYRIPSARLPGWDYRHAGGYFITICTQNRTHFFGECQQGKMKLTTAGMIAQGCWYQIPYLNPHVHLGAFVVMPNHVHGILILDDMNQHDNSEYDNVKKSNHGLVDGIDLMQDDGLTGNDGLGVGDGLGVETFDSNVSTATPKTDTPKTVNPKTYNPTTNKPITNKPTPNNPKKNNPKTKNPTPNNHETKNPVADKPNAPKNPFYQKISPNPGSVSRIVQQYKTVCTKHIRRACPKIDFEWQSRFYDHIIRDDVSFENITQYILNNPKHWKEDRFYDSI